MLFVFLLNVIVIPYIIFILRLLGEGKVKPVSTAKAIFLQHVHACMIACTLMPCFYDNENLRLHAHEILIKVILFLFTIAVELLNLQSLTQIAKTLTNNEHSHLKSDEKEKLRDALDIDKDEQRLIQSKYTDYQQILQMLLTWVTKIGAQNATKQNLAKILFSVKPSAHVVHMLHDNPQS